MSNDRKRNWFVAGFIALLLLVFTATLFTIVVGPSQRRITVDSTDYESRDLAKEKFFTEDLKAVKQPVAAPDGNAAFDFGYKPNPAASRQFATGLPAPFFSQAGPEERTPRFLYRAMNEAWMTTHVDQWICGTQGIGDCVSWGWKHGADICLAVRWKIGESSEWREAATESIYGGSRVEAAYGDDQHGKGGYSDGSYGAAAAKWVQKWGIVHRQKYDQLGIDLTKYDKGRAKDWGNFGCGGKGDNGKLDAIAKQFPVNGVTLVDNFNAAAKAIQNGYPVPVCSGQGFASTRDKDGFAAARGSWAHCMCFIAVRFEPRPGLLCLNSWGPTWISGPKYPADQPDGSFWVDEKTVDRMLSGKDSFAVSAYEGFKWRDLDNGAWVMTEPREIKSYYAQLERRLRENRDASQGAQFTLAP